MNDKNKNSAQAVVGDLLKKVVSTGIGAFFLTEEALKSALNEKSVPKDLVQGLMQNAKSIKDEAYKQIKQEFQGYLNKIDVTKEIGKILEKYDLDVQAKIKFNKRKND